MTQPTTQHTLFVCTTCASTWQDGKRVGTSGGEKLLAALQTLHGTWNLQQEFAIAPVECMSACNRPCSISFAATGKHTYLFGDLPVAAETLTETAQAVLECADQYYQKPDGLVSWSERPAALKKGVVGRIPPLPH